MAYLLVILALLGLTCSVTVEADSCTVDRYSDVASAARNCDTLILKNIVIPARTTLAIQLKDNAKLIFDGRVTHAGAKWNGDLIQITGTNVDVSGTSNQLFDGLGARYSKGDLRPNVLKLKLINSGVRELKLKNCPKNCMIIQSDNTVLSNFNIDNHDLNYAENNVVFDVSSSTNIRVENSVINSKGNCVGITAGTNVVFDNLDCNGSGFRLSNKDGEAINVKLINSKIAYTSDAIHIRAYSDGGSGRSIQNVLYQNVELIGITRCAVDVQQSNPNDITNLTLENLRGSVIGSNSQALKIICSSGGCVNFIFTDVRVNGAGQSNICQNVSC